MRQLIAIEFSPGGRQYTYHHDGPEVIKVDETVVVMVHGKPKNVLVVSTNPPAPKFETKAIMGKADLPQKPQGRLL